MAYAMLAYATTPYAVMAYAVMSIIQIQPMWRQHSEGEDPEALSLSSPLCAAMFRSHKTFFMQAYNAGHSVQNRQCKMLTVIA